jgi:hypothetical protein
MIQASRFVNSTGAFSGIVKDVRVGHVLVKAWRSSAGSCSPGIQGASEPTAV